MNCPRCGGQCLPSDDNCIDWRARTLTARIEIDRLEAAVAELEKVIAAKDKLISALVGGDDE